MPNFTTRSGRLRTIDLFGDAELLARITMFLRDVNYEKFDLAHGDTLLDPVHMEGAAHE